MEAEKQVGKVVEKAPKKGKVKVRIKKSVAGKFLLSYHVGRVVDLEAKQARELIDLGYADKA